MVFLACFAVVACSHLRLLHLPYFWDEGGYYVPAALDFYRSGTLIPVFTNAHPPLPNVVLGTLWHIFGLHILVTRLTACAFAGLALSAVFALGNRLLGRSAGLTLTLLTAAYPIWFAQSSLAHADIFAAAFTLLALALYLPAASSIGVPGEDFSSRGRIFCVSSLFCLSVLAKETAVFEPAALFCLELIYAWRLRASGTRSWQAHLRWAAALAVPILLLAGWFAYHFLKTGFVFGNPEFLRYNATANLTLGHIVYALRIRLVHLFWQRAIFLPIAVALICIPLPTRTGKTRLGLPQAVWIACAVVIGANLLGFSILGGALLTRYLLPAYPLVLLLCVAAWTAHVQNWEAAAVLTGAVFVAGWWFNPPTFFAPEDNLTYRDMILVQQAAVDVLNQRYPDATVLTAWPASAELFRPELGYTDRRHAVVQLENFSLPELARAAQERNRYNTALVFTTHYMSPAFRRTLLQHPQSWEHKRYAAEIDMTPQAIAALLGGTVVWQQDRNGEWAAILRFPDTTPAAAPLAFATVNAGLPHPK